MNPNKGSPVSPKSYERRKTFEFIYLLNIEKNLTTFEHLLHMHRELFLNDFKSKILQCPNSKHTYFTKASDFS